MFEGARSRRELVLTFLAMLELVKELTIHLTQSDTFGEIIITRREEGGQDSRAVARDER
jgi:chromatin segregation and condensation protein Rec8/ScpA/Scc1 (kleisin family)